MSGRTNIPWATDVWNPGYGCSKVSAGCANCYAEGMARRLAGMGVGHYPDVITDGHWNGQAKLDHDLLAIPYDWVKPRRIFAFSMSDLFHPCYPNYDIMCVLEAMRDNPRHRFVLLTKRPKRIVDDEWVMPDNVAIGVSVEDQKTFDERVYHLSMIRAPWRIVSMEPMIGPIIPMLDCDWIDWMILGGESGPRGRPMHPLWVKYNMALCVSGHVPFYFKQWGTWIPATQVPPRSLGAIFSRSLGTTIYMSPDGLNTKSPTHHSQMMMIRASKYFVDPKTFNGTSYREIPEGLKLRGE